MIIVSVRIEVVHLHIGERFYLAVHPAHIAILGVGDIERLIGREVSEIRHADGDGDSVRAAVRRVCEVYLERNGTLGYLKVADGIDDIFDALRELVVRHIVHALDISFVHGYVVVNFRILATDRRHDRERDIRLCEARDAVREALRELERHGDRRAVVVHLIHILCGETDDKVARRDDAPVDDARKVLDDDLDAVAPLRCSDGYARAHGEVVL